jgi:Na+-transporting NADH:ubiquinone oxidoreductase subunit F
MIRTYKALVVENKRLNSTVCHIRLKLLEPREIGFKAGQYLEIDVDGTKKGYFSIASPPSDRYAVELCVKNTGGTASTFLWNLKKDDTVSFNAPHFILRQHTLWAALFVAGGTGIAPMRSMLRTLFEQKTQKHLTLIFGVKNQEDVFYFDEFSALEEQYENFRFLPTIEEPNSAWKGERGTVVDVLNRLTMSFEEREAYICGGSGMIEAVKKSLLAKGCSDDRIYREDFY